jgi:peptide/nickel transport system substrate-binding protein
MFAIAWTAGDPRLAAASESGRDRLTIAVNDIPKTTFPIGAPTSTSQRYLRGFVGRSLTIYDKSWAVACELCTKLPTLENGQAKIVERADGSKGIDVTFEFKPGLQWGDGVPISSADVVFSVELAHKLGTGASSLSNILEVAALDSRHFTLRTSSVRFDYNRLEDLVLLPAHLEEALFRNAATPNDYIARSTYTKDPTQAGLYYGPYRIASFGRDVVELERNPSWSGRRPAFEKIVLRSFSDTATVSKDLVGGQVDMIAGEVGINTEAAYALERKDSKSSFDFIFKTNLEYAHIDLNLGNPILADLRIRRALLLSIDRTKLFAPDEPMDPREIPASFLPPTSPNYDPTLEQIRYDPAAAGALFERAGFRQGSDGIRIDATGRRLSFRLLAQVNWQVGNAVIEGLLAQWRQSGVEVVVDRRVVRETLPLRDFDMAYYSWKNTPEFLLEPVYARAGIPTIDNGYSGLNFPGLDDRDMNETAHKLTTELDPSKRLMLWQKAQQIYAEQLPALPLTFVTNVYVVPNWLTGVEPTGHMIPTSYWVEDWQVR